MEHPFKLTVKRTLLELCDSRPHLLPLFIFIGTVIIMSAAFTINGLPTSLIVAISAGAFLIVTLSIFISVYVKRSMHSDKKAANPYSLSITLFVIALVVTLLAGSLVGNFIGYLFKILLHAN